MPHNDYEQVRLTSELLIKVQSERFNFVATDFNPMSFR